MQFLQLTKSQTWDNFGKNTLNLSVQNSFEKN